MRSEGDASDPDDDRDFTYRAPGAAADDPDSQWESDTPAAPARARKPPAPPPAPAPLASRSDPRAKSTSKVTLNPATFRSTKTTHFYTSRASSAGYNGPVTTASGRKAPLVLLHVTLLFLPGAEEAILRKITPTMLERGLLVEHPRGDYQLLEELIIDSLGLDEALDPEFELPGDSEAEDPEQEAWEKSLGVRRVQAKHKWELRVYAANGLMTAGAWKRVWGEMERVDVELGPKGWRGRETDELIRGFLHSGGRGAGGMVKRRKWVPAWVRGVDWRWIAGALGTAFIMITVLAIGVGAFWWVWKAQIGQAGKVYNELVADPLSLTEEVGAIVEGVQEVVSVCGEEKYVTISSPFVGHDTTTPSCIKKEDIPEIDEENTEGPVAVEGGILESGTIVSAGAAEETSSAEQVDVDGESAAGFSEHGDEPVLLEFGEDGGDAGWWNNLKVGRRT